MQHPRYQRLFLACGEELRPSQADTSSAKGQRPKTRTAKLFAQVILKDLTETWNRPWKASGTQGNVAGNVARKHKNLNLAQLLRLRATFHWYIASFFIYARAQVKIRRPWKSLAILPLLRKLAINTTALGSCHGSPLPSNVSMVIINLR